MLRWRDELWSSGVGDGCTVQIMNMRGGGNHINQKNKAEKKPASSPKKVNRGTMRRKSSRVC